MDLSLPATHSHAPHSQQRGSGTPWAAKRPLWKPQRQSVRSLTTALVLQFLFWRDRCQVIQINTWGGTALFSPAFHFPRWGPSVRAELLKSYVVARDATELRL